MAITPLKFAVYYGTIRLNTGAVVYYSPEDIAAYYNVSDQPYLAVPLTGPSPFRNGPDELSYVHLKPLPDGQYYDAKERYNYMNEIQYQEDFDARRGGKWAVRPLFEDTDT